MFYYEFSRYFLNQNFFNLNIFFTRKLELRCWQKLIKTPHRDVITRETGEKCKYKKFKLAKNNCMRLQNDSFSIMTSEDALYWEYHRERYFTLIFWLRNRMFPISSRFYMTKGAFDLWCAITLFFSRVDLIETWIFYNIEKKTVHTVYT